MSSFAGLGASAVVSAELASRLRDAAVCGRLGPPRGWTSHEPAPHAAGAPATLASRRRKPTRHRLSPGAANCSCCAEQQGARSLLARWQGAEKVITSPRHYHVHVQTVPPFSQAYPTHSPLVTRHSSIFHQPTHHRPGTRRTEAESKRRPQREGRLAELSHVALQEILATLQRVVVPRLELPGARP